jgi:NDP-sugar pyrophosphorylase family protein
VESYDPLYFFESTDPLFSSIFEGVKHVWDAIPLIISHINRHINPAIRGFVEEGAWVEVGSVQLDPGSRVERGAIVRGPAIIGGGTLIRSGAYIRGDVIIGKNCVVGNSTEIRQIILMDGSALPHKNDIFTSIIGVNVNLGGMASTANYRLDGGEIFVRLNINGVTEKFRTGLNHLGAIIGDGTQIGGQCLLQPGTIIGKGCRIHPMSLVSGHIPSGSVYGTRKTHKYER